MIENLRNMIDRLRWGRFLGTKLMSALLLLTACDSQSPEVVQESITTATPVVSQKPDLSGYCKQICERAATCSAELAAESDKAPPATGGDEQQKCVTLCVRDVPDSEQEWALLRRARRCLDESDCSAFTDCFSKVPAE
jgi:hypothetical protein